MKTPPTPSFFETDMRNIFNLSAGLVMDHWEATLWAKNILDDTYTTYHDDRSAIGVPQTTAYGDPRTFGISLTLHQ